jgi:hypothetical protein
MSRLNPKHLGIGLAVTLTITTLAFCHQARGDELLFVDPWFPRARLLIVPERQPRTIIIRPRAPRQAPVDHCKTKAQSESFCRGAAWCICWNQEEEDGNEEKEKAGV